MLASKQLTLTHVSVADETTGTGQLAATPTGDAATEGAAVPRPAGRRRLIFAIVSIGLFMASIDQTNVMVLQHVFEG